MEIKVLLMESDSDKMEIRGAVIQFERWEFSTYASVRKSLNRNVEVEIQKKKVFTCCIKF